MLLSCIPLWANPAGSLEPDFHGWVRAETVHFTFLYEQRDADSVGQLVSFAEDVYQNVTDLLGSRPDHVWVVVAGRVDLANAVTYPFPPHITLYLAPPSEPLAGLDASSYLRLLLAHELSHYVNFEHGNGFFASLSTIFGPVVKEGNAAFLPTWFLEGIATHSETAFTDGGRGRNPFFEMEPRAFALERRFFPLRKAAYSSFFPPSDRDWIGGYLFFRYLLSRYGNSIYRQIYDGYVKFPFLGPGRAIERATGQSANALYAEMVSELETRYPSENLQSQGTRAMPDGATDYFLPAVTSRGWYLYRVAPDEAPGIVLFDPATKQERLIISTPLTDSVSLSASPDGSRVVFSTYQTTLGKSGTVITSDLFELDPGGGKGPRRITNGARAWQPRLSPDGSRLLAVSAVGPCSRLVEVDQRDGSMRLLFSMRGAIVSAPSVSPDGGRVAFSVSVQGAWSIRVLPLSSPEVPLRASDPITDFNAGIATTVIGPTRKGAYYPWFTSTGGILFSSNMSGSLALYVTDTQGNRTALVCEDPVGAWAGELAGNQVLYATYRAGNYTVMSKEVTDEPRDPPPVDPAGTIDEIAGPPLAQLPYSDVPRFMAWAPLPIYPNTVASGEIVIAPGAAFWGLSNLGTSSYMVSVSFRTDALQPGVGLSLQTTVGTVGLGYSLSEGYTTLSPSDHRQELNQQVSVSFPLIASTILSSTSALSLFTSVNDSLQGEGPQTFSFVDGMGAGPGSGGLSYSHDIDATVGASFQRSSIGSPMDMFALSQTFASLSVSAYPPVLSSSGPGVVTMGQAALSFPSAFPHQAVQLGMKSSYVSLNESFYQLTNPRGAFAPVVQTMPGRTLISLDYQVPIALLDVPLAYSLGLVGVGCGFHVEAAADWSVAPPLLVPDRDIYAGVELVLLIASGEQSFPVGVGVSFRFDPRLATPPDWATDLRPYIFLSNNGFAGFSRLWKAQ